MFAAEVFFDLSYTEHSILFEGVQQVWEVLPKLAGYLNACLEKHFQVASLMPSTVSTGSQRHRSMGGDQSWESAWIGPQVFIGEGTVVEPGVMIKGPAWIGEGCEIRHGAYLRENVILGRGVVVGNSCELKNCLLLDQAQVPHFNYVGDSILGYQAHLGAGVILSNVRLDQQTISVLTPQGEWIATGLKKFGAIVGDYAEVGCHAVINPGSLLGKKALIYPGLPWKGVLPANHLAKGVVKMEIREHLGS